MERVELIIPETDIIFEGDHVIKTAGYLDNGIREVIYYKSIDHPNIIKCEDVKFMEERHKIQITFQKYIPIDQLYEDFIKDDGLVTKLFMEISDTLAYLEYNNILHSDIKDGNIFYDPINNIFMLADFDLSYYTTECFINRTATPLTRPPELAMILIEEENEENNRRPFQKIKPTFEIRTPYKDSVSNWKGDIFSLGVVVSSLLLDGEWYPSDIYEQSDENYFNSLIEELTERISDYEYYDLLLSCLSFDYQDRPTPTELSRDLGITKTYKSCKMTPIDKFDLYDIIYKDITEYEKIESYSPYPLIVRKRQASNMFVTYFTKKNRSPLDILEYALIMNIVLYLTALLCFEDSTYYPSNIVGYFVYDGKYWSHEEFGNDTYSKVIDPYDGSVEEFLSEYEKIYYDTLIDVCTTFDFHLLF